MTDFDLSITRQIAAPLAVLYRCWTDPALLVRWFTLASWVSVSAKLDVRPGGASLIVMHGPDGSEMHNRDQYLEVVPNERLILTDAYLGDWVPSDKPFMTVVLTFAEEDGGTRYKATVRHWSAEDRDAHAAMGFDANWNTSTDQLAALAVTL